MNGLTREKLIRISQFLLVELTIHFLSPLKQNWKLLVQKCRNPADLSLSIVVEI